MVDLSGDSAGIAVDPDAVADSSALHRSLHLPVHIALTEPIERREHVQIWKARDARRGKDVVVKITTESRVANKIEAEARALARVTHPNILPIVAVGSVAPDTAWIVTDFARFGTLEEVLCQPARTNSRDLRRWLAQVASALASAHGAQVIHGDVTPSNIFISVDSRGRKKAFIGDFGSASSGESPGQRGGFTPRYSAPERRSGARATARSDVYGFSATARQVLGLAQVRPGWRRGRMLTVGMRPSPKRRPAMNKVARRLKKWA